MSLLTHGLQSSLLPILTFILNSWVGVLTYPFSPGTRTSVYSFLDQVIADVQQGLESILTASIETPELDMSLDEPDAATSSASSWFFHSVLFLILLYCRLAPSIRSHKLWCQARALFAPMSLATKMSASKLIHYFCGHPMAFVFWSSTPPDNITLTTANCKADQSLSEFQTGIGTAVQATLDMEQLISCL